MKLVYTEEPTRNVKLGDLVTNFRGRTGIVKHFIPPHKPSSSGHISIQLDGTMDAYNYVGVWGMEWIEREDRRHCVPGSRKCRSVTHCKRYGECLRFVRDHEGGP